MEWIHDLQGTHFIIFSDSMSALESLASYNPRNPLTQLIQALLFRLPVVFCWIPGHVGIAGNERADAAAKHALSGPLERDLNLVPTDAFSTLRERLHATWQASWEQQDGNKLRAIKNTISTWHSVSRRNRREEVVLARLRIGHTHLTHPYLL